MLCAILDHFGILHLGYAPSVVLSRTHSPTWYDFIVAIFFILFGCLALVADTWKVMPSSRAFTTPLLSWAARLWGVSSVTPFLQGSP
jgi:hypothetical protein